MSTWSPCTCPDCKAKPQHAVWDLDCEDTGDKFRVLVPFEHRDDPSGWGHRERAFWSGEDGQERQGLVLARGPRGITVQDKDGVRPIGHGHFRTTGGAVRAREPRLLSAQELAALTLEKAKRPPPAGARWITVRPNGPGTEGHPVMITPHQDGTWRIIGGAGGKLNHLILHHVKPPPTKEEKAKQDAARRDKERRRKEALSTLELQEEQAKKDVLASTKAMAERKFVKAVREKHGGIEADLTPQQLDEIPPHLRPRFMAQQHRRQVGQAQEIVRTAKAAVLDAERVAVAQAHDIRRTLEADPEVATEIVELAGQLVAEDERQARERRAERQARSRGKGPLVGKQAGADEVEAVQLQLVAAQEAMQIAEDPGLTLIELGGDKAGPLDLHEGKASDHVRREAARAAVEAKALLEIASGEADLTSPELAPVVAKLREDLGLAEDDPGLTGAALREAERKTRVVDIATLEFRKVSEIERESPERAHRAIEAKVAIRRSAKNARDLRRLGLGEGQKVPIADWEVGSLLDVMRADAQLKRAQRALEDLADEAEDEDFSASRDGFDMSWAPTDDDLAAGMEDELRTSLATDLLRLSNRNRPEWANAASAGRFDGLAEASLALAGGRGLDRVVVDQIGMRASAMLTRAFMEQAGVDPEAALEALEGHHLDAQVAKSQAALSKVQEIAPNLLDTVHEVGDLEQAMSQLDMHRMDVQQGQAAVGAAIGTLEATAALSQAFRERIPEHLSLPVAEFGSVQAAVDAAQNAGWTVGDLVVDHKAGTVQIPRSSWSKVFRKVDPADGERRAAVSAIKRGDHDDPDWLPAGFYRRDPTTFTRPAPDAPRSFQPLRIDEQSDVAASVRDHVARRLADGEDPVSIHRDLMAADRLMHVARRDEVEQAVRGLFPVEGPDGKVVPYDHASRADHWRGLVEEHLARTGDAAGSLHSQGIAVERPEVRDAALRAFAAEPAALSAFKQPHEVTRQDRDRLRDAFYQVTGQSKEATTAEAAWERASAELGPEPEKNSGSMSMFGGSEPSGEWLDWQARRGKLLQQHPWIDRDAAKASLGPRPKVVEGDPASAYAAAEWDGRVSSMENAVFRATTPWQRYLSSFPTEEEGIGAMQAELRGRFAQRFAEEHGKVTGQPVRLGVDAIPNAGTHLRAMGRPEDAEALAADLARLQGEHAALRARAGGGQFAAEGEGAVKRKYAAQEEQGLAMFGNQGALFGGGGGGGEEQAAPKIRPESGQRWTLGNRIEGQLASLVPMLEGSFHGGAPSLFPGLNMGGPRVDQQRAVRMMGANGGTLGGYLGPGSGKTFIMTGAFTEAHSRGETSHALVTTPAKVVEQFPGELAAALEPGKYQVETGTGMTYEQRIASLAGPSHVKVLGHEAMRDTLLELMSRHHGLDHDAMLTKMRSATPDQRADMLAQAREAAGIKPWFFAGDEAHKFTNREGQAHGLNLIAAAAAHPKNSTHRILATGTPHRNDEREVYSMLGILAPHRFNAQSTFRHNFGSDLADRPDAIRREVEDIVYSARIPPDGVSRLDVDNPTVGADGRLTEGPPVQLSPEQQAQVSAAEDAFKRVSAARKGGTVDVEAVKALAPHRFEGVAPAEHEAVAKQYQERMGAGLRDLAIRRAINSAPLEHNPKLRRLVDTVVDQVQNGTWTHRDGTTKKGKPAIVFSDHREEVAHIAQALQARGMRVATITGDDGHVEAERKRKAYQAGEYDVVVGTSAIEQGGNWQRAKAVHHYDVPQTWKSHQQRSGRAYRIKQQGDVDIVNHYTDHDFEQRALRRLRAKKALSNVFEDPTGVLDDTGLSAHYRNALQERSRRGRMAA